MSIEGRLSQLVDGKFPTFRVHWWISKLIDPVNDRETLIKCRTWLNPLQNAEEELNNNLNNKTEGTCTWILGMKEFNSIIEDKRRQHLWIYGQPGKSLTPQYRGYSTNVCVHHRRRQVCAFQFYDPNDTSLLIDKTPSAALLLQRR